MQTNTCNLFIVDIYVKMNTIHRLQQIVWEEIARLASHGDTLYVKSTYPIIPCIFLSFRSERKFVGSAIVNETTVLFCNLSPGNKLYFPECMRQSLDVQWRLTDLVHFLKNCWIINLFLHHFLLIYKYSVYDILQYKHKNIGINHLSSLHKLYKNC